ncbi:conserved hypothetical protein [Aeromicrobium sp. 9AM]|nr:conserved hypothetical protein [Aeromicrobium sp. 9AM]
MKAKPALVRRAALTLHRSHTEKPRCSPKIDQIRLRLATARPVDSQNAGFSGSHSSIHLPVRRAAAGGVGCCSGGLLTTLVMERSVVMDPALRRICNPETRQRVFQTSRPRDENDVTLSAQSCGAWCENSRAPGPAPRPRNEAGRELGVPPRGLRAGGGTSDRRVVRSRLAQAQRPTTLRSQSSLPFGRGRPH